MKKVIKYFILLGLLFPGCGSFASHYLGGEITWECTGSNHYRFILKLYRECNGNPFYNVEYLDVTNYPLLSKIPMNLITKTDISPKCNSDISFQHITCSTAYTPNTGAVEELIFVSDSVYPGGVPLTGVPPPQGWIFSHNGFARNFSTNIPTATNIGWYLRAIMYPYNGQSADICYDNSPVFAEKPSTVICTGYPFTYNHNAWDKDLDSLSYSWAQPLDSSGIPITSYASGYSYFSPTPGTLADPNNVPATVNPYTGEISFTSYTQGFFVTVTKVASYKCGIKVAEIFREMQIVLLACGNNSPPVLTPPFPPGGPYISYRDTVYAGEYVTFNLSAFDNDLLPNGNAQTLTLFASGQQFGSTSSSGCLNPPCAVLNPAPSSTGLSNPVNVSTAFSWQTDCNHLATNAGCGATSNVYNFIIKVQDDFCPAPAISVATITVVVLAKNVLPPPQIRCASVSPAGDVNLTWAPAVDTSNSFDSYHIFYSTSPNGPFTSLTSLSNINFTTFTHIGAGANMQPLYYYMKTRSGCGGIIYSDPSDTIKTMLLSVYNQGNGGITSSFSWNPLYNPNLPTSSGWYNIYREYPPGNWTLIDSTKSLSYTDTLVVCGSYVNYHVSIDDSLPCTSSSSYNYDYFSEPTSPAIPLFDSVSVDSISGYSVLGWEPSSSGDTEGYVIYQNQNGSVVPIDTVFGINNTSYVNTNTYWSNPDSTTLCYYIAVFDTCHNMSNGYTDPLWSVLLTSEPDDCGNGVNLYWSPTENISGGMQGYEVYMRQDFGPSVLLGTTIPSVRTFKHSPLVPNSTYIFTVRSISTNGNITATSNNDTLITISLGQAQYAYIRHATVKNCSYIELDAIVDTSVFIDSCKIMRSEDGVNFTYTGTTRPLPNTNSVIFNDTKADADQKCYYYKMILVDSCGNEMITSNTSKTIFLTAKPRQNMKNELNWDEYKEWLGNVSDYNIYRKIDDITDPAPIVTLPAGTYRYIDDVSDYTSSEGRFTYYVEALEGTGNQYLIADSSQSNCAFALQYPRIFIPNAFTPSKDINNVFIPVNVYVSAEEFQFSIYDRWGLQIFNSTDTGLGWDGTFEGKPANQGVYIYFVRFKDSRNKYVEKRGTVTLLR